MKYVNPQEQLHRERLDAIHDLEKKIAFKKTNLQGQGLARHQAVLSFLKVQIQKPDHTQKKTAKQVAEYYGQRSYVAEKIVTWEIQWMTTQTIEEGKRSCHTKSFSWFNYEGIQLAVRECISYSGDKLSASKLARVIEEYLGSQTVTNTVESILEQEAASKENNSSQLFPNLKIRVWTA